MATHTLDNGNVQQVATYIGSSLWWRLPKIRIKHDDLVLAAKKHNVPQHYLPTKTTYVSAFKRGLRNLTTNGYLSSNVIQLRSDQRIKLSQNTKTNVIRYAIILETETDSKRIQSQQIGNIDCIKEYRTLRHEVFHELDLVTEIYAKLVQATDDSLCHDTNDIRGIITSFTRRYAVSLRPGGGIYFVPKSHEPELKNIISMIQEIQPLADFFLDPKYILTDSDLKAIRKVALEEISQEIRASIEQGKAVVDLVNNLQRNLKMEKGAKTKIARQLREFVDLKKRAQQFSNSLSFNLSSLGDLLQLNQLHQQLDKALSDAQINFSDELKFKADTPQPSTGSVTDATDVIKNRLLKRLRKYQ